MASTANQVLFKPAEPAFIPDCGESQVRRRGTHVATHQRQHAKHYISDLSATYRVRRNVNSVFDLLFRPQLPERQDARDHSG